MDGTCPATTVTCITTELHEITTILTQKICTVCVYSFFLFLPSRFGLVSLCYYQLSSQAENTSQSEAFNPNNVATHLLVFMVRGLLIDFEFPYTPSSPQEQQRQSHG